MYDNGNTEKLTEVARTDKDPKVRMRGHPGAGFVQSRQHGRDHASHLYGSEQDPQVKRADPESRSPASRNAKALVDIYHKESNFELKKDDRARLQNMRTPEANELFHGDPEMTRALCFAWPWLALPLAAQPKLLVNANLDTHSAGAGLEAAFKPLLAAQPQPAWIGWAVPSVRSYNMGCEYVFRDGQSTSGPGRGASGTARPRDHHDPRGSRRGQPRPLRFPRLRNRRRRRADALADGRAAGAERGPARDPGERA